MPLPMKGEKKQDYINRCTKDLIAKEGKSPDQARAICESYWDRPNEPKTYAHVMDQLTNTPWLITQESLESMVEIVERHIGGAEINIAEIEAATGKKLKNDNPATVKNRIATIPLIGPISKRMSMMSDMSGGTSTEKLQNDIQEALDNKEVDRIMLNVDSPGGSASGVFEVSDFIYANRGKKPIIAYADGQMTSAAYLIASAADEVIGYTTSPIGSIGVVAIHEEKSKAYEHAGIKKTVISSGKYKALGNEVEPLTSEAKTYLQEKVDTYHNLFIDHISRNRGISRAKAEVLADGKTYIGQQALDVGLIDHLGDINLALKRAAKRRKKMDVVTLKSEHPETAKALQEEGLKIGFDQGRQAGINEERQRISEIRECCPPGLESLCEQYIKENKSVTEAMKGFLVAQKAASEAKLNAEKNLKEQKLEQLRLESPEGLPNLKEKKELELSNLPLEKRAEAEWNSKPELRDEFKLGGLPAYIAYLQATSKGLTKIFSRTPTL